MESVEAMQTIEKLLAMLTRAEKARLLQWVARDIGDTFPGIENTPGVCGDEPCIVRTRIPVWVLVRAKQLGKNDADILNAFPTLRAEDLANVWAYARSHKKEIEGQIQENEAAQQMARLYSNENFPFPVVQRLRQLGHDVLTIQETGKAEQAMSDDAVLLYAMTDERALLTLNRKHFIQLHKEESTPLT